MVKTQDGSLSFLVVADPTNSGWQAASSSYCLAGGVTAIDLPIVAAAAGASGNILPNTITLLASPVPKIIPSPTNRVQPGGEDPEMDPALRKKFTNFFAAQSKATMDAISYAISSVGANLRYAIQENIDATGSFRAGIMTIVVDDGSGAISDTLLSSLSTAVGMRCDQSEQPFQFNLRRSFRWRLASPWM